MNEIPEHPSVRQIQEEHEELRELLGRLEGDQDKASLLALLKELRSLLEEHFQHEEAPGAFEQIVRERATHLMPRVDELVREHRQFLAELDEIIASEQTGASHSQIRERSQALSRELHSHEARENELIIDAYFSELGGRG